MKKGSVQFFIIPYVPFMARVLIFSACFVYSIYLGVFEYETFKSFIFWFLGLIFVLPRPVVILSETDSLKEEWCEVTDRELLRIKKIVDNLPSWTFIDRVVVVGIVGFLLLHALVREKMLASFVSLIYYNIFTAVVFYILISAVIIWVLSGPLVDKNEEFIVKFKALYEIYKKLKGLRGSFWKLIPMVKFMGNKRRRPDDIRLKFEQPSEYEDFYGIQIQCSANKVRSKYYPYVYAVVIAKPQLLKEKPQFAGYMKSSLTTAVAKAPTSCVIETQSTKDAYVWVVRQKTTKTSGYETSHDVAMGIVRSVLVGTKTFFEKFYNQG